MDADRQPKLDIGGQRKETTLRPGRTWAVSIGAARIGPLRPAKPLLAGIKGPAVIVRPVRAACDRRFGAATRLPKIEDT